MATTTHDFVLPPAPAMDRESALRFIESFAYVPAGEQSVDLVRAAEEAEAHFAGITK